jgi:hypothetical protein
MRFDTLLGGVALLFGAALTVTFFQGGPSADAPAVVVSTSDPEPQVELEENQTLAQEMGFIASPDIAPGEGQFCVKIEAKAKPNELPHCVRWVDAEGAESGAPQFECVIADSDAFAFLPDGGVLQGACLWLGKEAAGEYPAYAKGMDLGTAYENIQNEYGFFGDDDVGSFLVDVCSTDLRNGFERCLAAPAEATVLYIGPPLKGLATAQCVATQEGKPEVCTIWRQCYGPSLWCEEYPANVGIESARSFVKTLQDGYRRLAGEFAENKGLKNLFSARATLLSDGGVRVDALDAEAILVSMSRQTTVFGSRYAWETYWEEGAEVEYVYGDTPSHPCAAAQVQHDWLVAAWATSGGNSRASMESHEKELEQLEAHCELLPFRSALGLDESAAVAYTWAAQIASENLIGEDVVSLLNQKAAELREGGIIRIEDVGALGLDEIFQDANFELLELAEGLTSYEFLVVENIGVDACESIIEIEDEREGVASDIDCIESFERDGRLPEKFFQVLSKRLKLANLGASAQSFPSKQIRVEDACGAAFALHDLWLLTSANQSSTGFASNLGAQIGGALESCALIMPSVGFAPGGAQERWQRCRERCDRVVRGLRQCSRWRSRPAPSRVCRANFSARAP